MPLKTKGRRLGENAFPFTVDVPRMRAVTARHLTVRDVPLDVARALSDEQRRLGLSLEATVIALLQRALGLADEKTYDNGLGRFANTWTQRKREAFDRATAQFETIDEEMWR